MSTNSSFPSGEPAGTATPAEGLPSYSASSIPTAPQVDPHAWQSQSNEWEPLRKFDFVEACGRYWKGYARFRGRAGIAEYWTAIVAMSVAAGIIGLIPLIGQVAGLAFILPTYAYGVRRLHDANLSGWFIIAPLALSVTGFFFVLKSLLSLNTTEILRYADEATSQISFSSMDTTSLLIGMAFSVVAFIAHIVLMCLPPKQAGVRFD